LNHLTETDLIPMRRCERVTPVAGAAGARPLRPRATTATAAAIAVTPAISARQVTRA
jgi:hypothetical protein